MTTAAEVVEAGPRPNALARVWRAVKRHALTVYAILAIVYLMLPIAVVILFSFNRPAGRFNYVWQEFTLDNWVEWDAVLGIRDAVVTSLQVGVLATLVATVLGTLIALAIVRHEFRGRGVTNVLVFLPMSTPEIVLGASLLTLFLNMTTVFTLGFWTIFIAHVMFIVSYIVVTVKARLIGFDRHLEEAAMDLGANEWTTFRKVTLPLLAPAIVAAALLGFALSIDDFVITYFNAGGTQTFPVFVWGIARVSVPPQVNVVASAIFIVAIAIALANVVWQYRSARRSQGAV
ncbi:MAG TPA: ABC transporter permease [Gaiella sp.]|nr:ABC transporter permease [Gaiella sp.]HET9288992.1 ABC transporter permease [Gaiella sp.]